MCPLPIVSVELVLSKLDMSFALGLVCSAVVPLGKRLESLLPSTRPSIAAGSHFEGSFV